jgi:hypothetical protein
MMQACYYADVSKRGLRCGPQIGLAVVNRRIATAAPFTMGARSMDRPANSAFAMPCRRPPQTLPDASLMQNRRKGHNDTT